MAQSYPLAWEKSQNKVCRRGRRQKDGGRKRGAEGLETAASLLLGTRARDGGGRQNRGKTSLTAQENEREKGGSLYTKGRRRRWLQRKPLRPFGYGKLRRRENRRF